MTSVRPVRVRRVVSRLLAVCASVTVLALAAACPYAGRYLIVEQPLQPADVIVVLAGTPVERWLEAVDLHREGLAPAILLSPGYEDPLGDELRARGIRFPRTIDLQKDAMRQLGTPDAAIEIMSGGYDNTADEAAGVRALALARGWRRVMVVTSKYHTRRSLFAFTREMRDTAITIHVRGSRYDRVSPDQWWKSRSDARWVASELQKLLVYRLGVGK